MGVGIGGDVWEKNWHRFLWDLGVGKIENVKRNKYVLLQEDFGISIGG